jgi:hypothetical protein
MHGTTLAGDEAVGPDRAADTDITVELRPSPLDEELTEMTAQVSPPSRDVQQGLTLQCLTTIGVPGARKTGELPGDPDNAAEGDATKELFAALPEHASEAAGNYPSVNGYELLGVLGRGGMGVVYMARQSCLNRIVALKMILSGHHAAAKELQRFRLEAEAVARLQHPNIVQIYEVGEQVGLPYFTLEYVEGGSLAKKLSAGPLPAREAALLTETLARAIHAAHQNGIVHRDLKPGNVLLSKDGVPKIADFGLAKYLGAGDQTHSGILLGTPSYMAPEQAAGRTREIGPATDVYALGAILYEMLTGRAPFRGATLLETLEQVQFHEPVPPGRIQLRLPRNLDAICLKCLEKDPRRRYASAEALAEDLRRFRVGEAVQARPANLLARAWLWCHRPNRVREAGVLTTFLGTFFLVYELLGFVGLALGRLPTARHPEAEWYLAMNILFVSLPTLLIGLATLRKKLIAVWAGAAQALLHVLVSRVLGWQDQFGFEFDYGGMMPTFEARSPFFALTEVLAATQLLAYTAALIAYYANWDLMRPSLPESMSRGAGQTEPAAQKEVANRPQAI